MSQNPSSLNTEQEESPPSLLNNQQGEQGDSPSQRNMPREESPLSRSESSQSDSPYPPAPTENATLKAASRWFLIAASGWYLLQQLGPVVKPLLLAVLIAYVLLPIYSQVKKRTPRRFALVVFGILSIGVVVLLGFIIQNGVMSIREYLPEMKQTIRLMFNDLQAYFSTRSPQLAKFVQSAKELESEFDNFIMESAVPMLNFAGSLISGTAIVGLYLLFLLLELGRAPDRIQHAFRDRSAQTILAAVKEINESISHYLYAKVKASLILAVPTTLVLAVFQVRLAVFWGALTFFMNFVPYVGAVISFTAPMIFVLLKYQLGWPFWVTGALLIAIQGLCSSWIEPKMIGKSVGVSPLVILFFLAFWGYCWGATGMVLAVPLTVMLKIIFSNIEATQPLAKLMSEK